MNDATSHRAVCIDDGTLDDALRIPMPLIAQFPDDANCSVRHLS